MMKKSLFIIVFFCFGLFVKAQNHAANAYEYASEGKYAEAITEYESARDYALTVKKDTTLYFNYTFGESNCYYMLDNYAKVLDLAHQFARIYNKVGISDKIQLSHYCKMMGTYYYGITDENAKAYRYSESYYLDSEKYLNELETYGNKDADLKILHQELAQLYYKWKEYALALKQLNLLQAEDDREAYLFCSQKAMCLARMGKYEVAIDSIDKALKGLKGDKQEYPEALRKKGKILMMQADNKDIDNWKAAKVCYQEYVDHKKVDASNKLSSLSGTDQEKYWLGMHSFLYDCYRLGDQASDMLYNLALFSKGYLLEYRKNPKATQKTWKEVKSSLNSQECAIEFVQYYGKDDVKYLAAMVVKSSSKKPQFISLCCVDKLKKISVGSYNVEDALQSSESFAKDELYYAKDLYRKYIWTDELMSAIGNAKKVYFSPDGILQSWAIEYEYPDAAILPCRLTSTRLLINRKKSSPASYNALLCGGIKYDEYQAFEGKSASPENDRYAYSIWHNNVNVDYLPGTYEEVVTIDSVREKTGRYRDALVSGPKATDELLCNLISLKKYPIIHISTHGFFLSNSQLGTDLKSSISDNTLSQSGIVMAGAATLLNDPSENESKMDGLLTAKEISEVDMSNVQLVVLSACQTGQGVLTDDGVYGMQRGLKMAGAKTMMLSLWNVNDAATCELMSKFYEELKTCNDVVKAFKNARNHLINDITVTKGKFSARSLSSNKSRPSYNRPRFTNAFILIDAL